MSDNPEHPQSPEDRRAKRLRQIQQRLQEAMNFTPQITPPAPASSEEHGVHKQEKGFPDSNWFRAVPGESIAFSGFRVNDENETADFVTTSDNLPFGEVVLGVRKALTHDAQDSIVVQAHNKDSGSITYADGVTGVPALPKSGQISELAAEHYSQLSVQPGTLEEIFDAERVPGKENTLLQKLNAAGLPIDQLGILGETTLQWLRFQRTENGWHHELLQVGGKNVGFAAVIEMNGEIKIFPRPDAPQELTPLLLKAQDFGVVDFSHIESGNGARVVLCGDGVGVDPKKPLEFFKKFAQNFPMGTPVNEEKLRQFLDRYQTSDDITFCVVDLVK